MFNILEIFKRGHTASVRSLSFRISAIILISGLSLQAQDFFYGVNISGGEWAAEHIHGEYNKHYFYPTENEFKYYSGKGFKVCRLPFLWERVQHELNGDLDVFDISGLDGAIASAKKYGMRVILDMHNYARYCTDGKNTYVIGSKEVPISSYQDVWTKIAGHYKDESAIYGYGIMNEPHDMGGHSWFDAAQAAIDGIRSVDKTHTIVVAGNDWQSAWRWQTSSDDLKYLVDSNDNLMFDAHQYFDGNAGGGYSQSYDEQKADPNIGVERLSHFVEWCKLFKKRGIVTEYGIPWNRGGDPTPNIWKYGFYKPLSGKMYPPTSDKVPTPVGPPGYIYCCQEEQTFTLPEASDVAYGVDGKFKFARNKTGTLQFGTYSGVFSDVEQWKPVLENALRYLYENKIGGMSWGGFLWSANENELSVAPGNYDNPVDKPQMAVLEKFTSGTGNMVIANSGVPVWNSGFETPDIDGEALALKSYNFAPTAWKITGYAGIQRNGSSFKAADAPEGHQTGILYNYYDNKGSIAQRNFFKAGTYVAQFMAARQNTTQTQPIKVSVDGKQIGPLFTPSGTQFETIVTPSFTIEKAGYYEFKFESTGDGVTFIDQITIQSAPDATATASGSDLEKKMSVTR